MSATVPVGVTNPADEFMQRLRRLEAELGRVPMRGVFALAKHFTPMPTDEIESLLGAPDHLTRVGAVSIMDFQARRRKTTGQMRHELYELYLRRHDRINTWDLVDRAAPHVVGGYLFERPRDRLYQLAGSADWYRRRTAIVATYYFIRNDDLDDTFAIADILAHDPEPLVQKAVGGWVREAGKRDPGRLREFLERHAATMPRTALRYAIEHLDLDTRRHYLEKR